MVKRIMFVCHGNICRSPMAELIFRHIAAERGLLNRFSVASSATSNEEIWNGVGNPVYPPAVRELMRHGIQVGDKRAVRLATSDYGEYDMFICMDVNNVKNATRILGGDPEGKISKLLNAVGSDADVADPWYTGDFSVTYREILSAVTALIDNLTEGKD